MLGKCDGGGGMKDRGSGRFGLLTSSSSKQVAVRWVVSFLLFAIIGGLPIQGQVSEIDRRKVDELILLDISGSMVRDIRTVLLRTGLARGQTDDNSFRLAPRVRID